jgi:hypothetical protein
MSQLSGLEGEVDLQSIIDAAEPLPAPVPAAAALPGDLQPVHVNILTPEGNQYALHSYNDSPLVSYSSTGGEGTPPRDQPGAPAGVPTVQSLSKVGVPTQK